MNRVLTLLYANLAISLVLAALTLAFYNQLVDFQTAHVLAGQSAGVQEVADTRSVFANTTWIRPVVVLAVSLLYVRIATLLRSGRRSTYIRVLVIAVIGSLGIGYSIVSGQFPLWLNIGLGVQVLVLLGLLFAATRPAFRSQFARKAVAA
ncbi:hypothetical protein GCM10010174_11150 [Kutzneria viridogrisea]|uniref:Uncharacterized protein n=2 Tax=Kutzneria TaxID=43356 RepID=W5WL53_9PSEU|nr:hypothetical protein [Kutzneria albida]AHI01282.1 hypothetical protein KALB_7924 [Kutzneria albida DSM 43870]MBA8926535.1 hypothetical protein [Kutzneria viridogrisea]